MSEGIPEMTMPRVHLVPVLTEGDAPIAEWARTCMMCGAVADKPIGLAVVTADMDRASPVVLYCAPCLRITAKGIEAMAAEILTTGYDTVVSWLTQPRADG